MKTLALMITTLLSLSSIAQDITHRLSLAAVYSSFSNPAPVEMERVNSSTPKGIKEINKRMAKEKASDTEIYKIYSKFTEVIKSEKISTTTQSDYLQLVELVRKRNTSSIDLEKDPTVSKILNQFKKDILVTYSILLNKRHKYEITIKDPLVKRRTFAWAVSIIDNEVNTVLNYRYDSYKELLNERISEIELTQSNPFGSIENEEIDDSLRDSIKNLRIKKTFKTNVNETTAV